MENSQFGILFIYLFDAKDLSWIFYLFTIVQLFNWYICIVCINRWIFGFGPFKYHPHCIALHCIIVVIIIFKRNTGKEVYNVLDFWWGNNNDCYCYFHWLCWNIHLLFVNTSRLSIFSNNTCVCVSVCVFEWFRFKSFLKKILCL